MTPTEGTNANSLVNVKDPDTLEIGSIPQTQLQEALSQGFTSVTPDEAKEYIRKQKYETPGQQLATAAEGAASAATFGLSTGLETGLNIASPEEIQSRREVNPGLHMAGEAAGLIGSSFLPGAGAANILEDAGKAVSGIASATTPLQKIGSQAVKMAAENALFQMGDEVSKGFSEDPRQNFQTAITDIGLSGLIGGATGVGMQAVSPLWKATVGPKVESFLKTFTDRANGIEGVATDSMSRAMDTLGIDVAPEIKSALSDNPFLREAVKTLEQSDTSASGIELQKSMKHFKNELSNHLVESLGRTPDDVASELSPYEAGKKIGSTLAEEFKSQVDPLAEKFEQIKEKYADLALPKDQIVETSTAFNPYEKTIPQKTVIPGTTSEIAEKIGNLVHQEGWYASPSSEIMTEVNRVLKELPKQETLKDLSHYITQIGNNTYDFTNPQLTRAGMLLKNIVRDAEADLVTKALGEKAPELVSEHAAARSAWAKASELKDSLQDRLHLGGGNSPTSFIKNLQEASQSEGEKILRRLSGANDAALLQTLSEQFPQTAELLKQYHVDQLLRKNSVQVGDARLIQSNKLMTSIEKMSPELKNFALPDGAMEKVKAVNALLSHVEELPHNFSNTARTADKLLNYLPGSAVSMISLLSGHPGAALVLGPLTKYLAKDIPDAIRLSMLKFMGASKQIDAEGFKAMVDYIQKTMKGESLLSKGTKAIFQSGREVLPQSLMPSEKETEKLDKRLMELKKDPTPLLKTGGKTGYYLPEHGEAMGETASRAVNYLNSIRPSVDKKAPLDTTPKNSKAIDAAFHQALEMAEQPLLVLPKIKEGTLTPQDLQHLNQLYPELRQKMIQKLTNEMTEALSKEVEIPYKTRLGLSLFMGEPLDSTMMSQSILAAQPKPQAPQPSMMKKAPSASSMNGLSKMPSMYQTPAQSREAHRLK